jgi:hypothetical protein
LSSVANNQTRNYFFFQNALKSCPTFENRTFSPLLESAINDVTRYHNDKDHRDLFTHKGFHQSALISEQILSLDYPNPNSIYYQSTFHEYNPVCFANKARENASGWYALWTIPAILIYGTVVGMYFVTLLTL